MINTSVFFFSLSFVRKPVASFHMISQCFAPVEDLTMHLDMF